MESQILPHKREEEGRETRKGRGRGEERRQPVLHTSLPIQTVTSELVNRV